jgi:CspA family cold shock protein|tara:strand:- start:385 stop:591 length:207 start_codon:yes stop_codon:yes gene_type:complete
MSLKGKVKWFNGQKDFGFIEREDKERDVFVHHATVREANLKHLNEGDELTFEVENGEKGPSAVKLQKT